MSTGPVHGDQPQVDHDGPAVRAVRRRVSRVVGRRAGRVVPGVRHGADARPQVAHLRRTGLYTVHASITLAGEGHSPLAYPGFHFWGYEFN